MIKIKEGSKFATLMVLGHSKFKPTQKIRILPTKEIELNIAFVTKPEINIAKQVTNP